MKTPTIQTSRLILRPLALSDAPAVQRRFNNWNIIRNLATVVPWPYPDDGAETFVRLQLEKIAAGEEIHHWVLTLRAGDGEAIGNIHFRPGTDNPKGNRGFWLAELYWNRGLMTEAISAVNDFVFNTLGIEQFYVCNVASNAASRRVKQKTGAEFVGYIELAHHNGQSKIGKMARDARKLAAPEWLQSGMTTGAGWIKPSNLPQNNKKTGNNMTSNWRDRAATTFQCQKQPASSSRGMVVSNHPLASSAGAEMLAAGGNAIDAAIATLFTLTVVEPMMVGIIGGGMAHIRLADGSHRFIDGQSSVPLSVRPDTYTSKPGSAHDVFDTVGDENLTGPKAVATPGSLKAWCETLRRFGTMSLADVMQPAIKHAARGYAATPYLHECITDSAADMRKDKAISAIYLPKGVPLKTGERVVQSEYAETLTYISQHGEAALYQGPLGDILVDYMKAHGGFITREDITTYKTVERQPVRADYRGWQILGPPPPAASGVHITEMLNILEGYDIAGLGFGSAETIHYLAEVLKIAFADRAAASGDPDFVNVPVERLTSKAYAEERRRAIDASRTQQWGAGVAQLESAHTTHMTAADAFGNVVATTQTINNLFGAKIMIPGLGAVPNNYMNLYDPRPGHALSLAPGKRVTTSMSPMMALRDGKLVYALGLPGGKRIFPSAMQALVNLIDHGMSLQEAVEAPRVWTEGNALEVESAVPESVRAKLTAMGHKVQAVPTVAGGMNAIQFHDDGRMSGAACWRADGTPIGMAGGLARAGVRFGLA